MEALKTTDGDIFSHFPASVQYNREIVLEAIKTKNAYSYLPQEMKADHEVIRAAISFNGMALEFAGLLHVFTFQMPII
jgi:hypothetical protein